MSTLTLFAYFWAAIAAVTLGLALIRKFVSAGEEDVVYLAASEEGKIPQQQALAARLNVIDKWGKGLTVVTVITGLALGSFYLYATFVNNGAAARFGS